MSAFAVFASSLPVARLRAEKRVPLVVKQTKVRLTESEWRAKVEEIAVDLFSQMAPVQVSPAFDAPQFAEEWISLARTTQLFEGFVIKCRGPKVDAKGKPVISKTKKTAVIG